MKKYVYAYISILTICLFLFGNLVLASRPFSVPCPFKGEVIKFEETTDTIEEFELTLKILSHDFVPLCEGCSRDDGIEDMCYFLDDATIKGTWYTPGQDYTKDQPEIDINKVLIKGSIIEGNIDSYDSIIKNVSLIMEGIKSDTTNDKDRNINFTIITIILILLISILILFFIKFKRK